MKRAHWLAACLVMSGAHAADQAPPAAPPPLQHLVGTWTIAGKEATYKEICDWYAGGHHVVCHTESRRKDGSIGHSMSILAHAPGQGFVYTGIGASGRYETYSDGTFEDGILQYTRRSGDEMVRVRMGPFGNPDSIPFAVHTSKDGKDWAAVDAFNYVRVKSASADNPVLGAWRWSAKDGSCTERHEYRADGTATIRSGEEVLQKSYTIERYKGGPFYLFHEEVTASNGGKDCTGHVTAVGKQSGMFVLPTNDGGYYTCSSNEGWGCFGTASRAEADH